MPMAEDLSVFYKNDEHGTAFTFDGAAKVGIFDREYRSPLNLVESFGPILRCALADVAGVDQDSTVVIAGVTWEVTQVERYTPTEPECLLHLQPA